MSASSHKSNGKSKKEIKINCIYNQQGEAFQDILKHSIKNLIQNGIIYKNILQSNKETVIEKGAKGEEL